MITVYPACFFKESNGYSVIFPDLDHLATCGDTPEEAMAMAIDCLAGYLFSSEMEGNSVPPASSMDTIDPAAVASELDFTYDTCFVNMVTVDVEAYAKEHFNRPVKKTLIIPSWLNDVAISKGINFSQTLKEALIAKVTA